MDKSVVEYKKRRKSRVDAKNGAERVDSVDAFKERRKARLEERMDASPRVAYGIAKGMGIDTTGMEPKEVYEAIAKNGGQARGKFARGNKEYEFHKSGNKPSFSGSYKTPGGVSLPKIKDGAVWDKSVLKEVDRIAKKDNFGKKYDRIVKNLKSDDIQYQVGADGKMVASLPGLSQQFNNKMSGKSAECNKIYRDKIQKGKQITKDMVEVTNDMPGRLMGLENCYKGGSSAAEKIERKRRKDIEAADALYRLGKISKEEADKRKSKTDEDYTRGFDDIVRYTILSDHDDTVKTVNDSIKKLGDKGYELVELDNKWLPTVDSQGNVKPSEYKAVHLTFKSPTGENFEVQVHSKESMKVKNLNHKLYEEQRSPKTSEGRAIELGAKMAKNLLGLKEPQGIMDLKTIKKKD